MSETPVIRLDAITKHFAVGEVKVKALNGVSFEIRRGECVGIMGPSGSGKTTLLYIVGCLMTPTSGAYTIDGTNVETLNQYQLARVRNAKVGFIFQAFNLLPRFNALENVALPMVYAKVPIKERRQKAERLLDEVGLSGRMKHRPSQLSGGEQQRVAIARALVNDPAIILADEPTGNLDTASGSAIMDTLINLNRQGRTVIIVTHEQSIAGRTSRIVRLLDGKSVN
jgi:putative ABC transport system ATP-binding protein